MNKTVFHTKSEPGVKLRVLFRQYATYLYGFIKTRYRLEILGGRPAVILSFLVVVLTCSYTTIMASLSQISTADQFVVPYITSQWHGGTIVLSGQHTSLMKFPILWLQGILPMNMFSFVTMNILFVLATFILWSVIIYKITRSSICLVISNLLLAGLLLGSTNFSIFITETAQRNIEYGLAFAYLVIVIYKLRRFTWPWWVGSIGLLGALVSSDLFFLYTLPATVAVGMGILWLQKKASPRHLLAALSSAICGTLGGLILLKILMKLHVLKLFFDHNSVIAYQAFWSQIQQILYQLMRLFGGDIFDRALSITTLLAFPALIYFVVTLVMLKRRLIKPAAYSIEPSPTLFLALFAFFVCLSYILSGQASVGDANIRHLTILPFVAVGIIVLHASSQSPSHIKAFLMLAIFMLAVGIARIPENHTTYTALRTEPQAWVNLDKNIIHYLKDNGVRTAFGSVGYSATTWFYSHKAINVYNIIPCNTTTTVLSDSNWYIPTGQTPTGLIVDRGFPSYAAGETWDGCSDKTIIATYGEPSHKDTIGYHSGQPVDVWIFDHDIRANMVH